MTVNREPMIGLTGAHEYTITVHFLDVYAAFLAQYFITDCEELAENAASAPDVNGVVVLALVQENLRRFVVVGLHLG